MISLEIMLAISQTIWNCFISRPNYTTLGHTPKGLYTLLQRFLLAHVHCCFIDNSHKLEAVD